MRGFAVLVVTLSLMTVAGCSRPPRSTVDAFLQALQRSDLQGMKEQVTKGSQSLLDKANLNVKEFTYELGEEKVDGDRAFVPVTLKFTDGSFNGTFVLQREEKEWKVDLKETIGKMFEDFARMFGQAMEEFFRSFGRALGEVGENLGKAIQEMNKGLERAGQQMERGFEEFRRFHPDPERR